MHAWYDSSAIVFHFATIHRLAKTAECEGVLVLTAFGEGIAPTAHHFAIGDIEGMTRAALAYQQRPGVNLYAPLCVMRADLEPNKKGGESDVVVVLGAVVDGDADKGAAAVPPVEANYVIETSAANAQHFIFFDRALRPIEAKPLLSALKRATGADCADDLSHVWRISGTLNWPNAAKIKRGRSPEPQRVRMLKPWNGDRNGVDNLRAVLEPHWHKQTRETIDPIERAVGKWDFDAVQALYAWCHTYSNEHPEDADGLHTYATWMMFAFAAGYEFGDHQGRALIDVVSYDPAEMTDAKWATCLRDHSNPVRLESITKWAHARGWKGSVPKSTAALFGSAVATVTGAPSIVPEQGLVTIIPPAGAMSLTAPRGELLPADCDDSLALSFASEHADDLRYVEEWGKWLRWDGARWRPDRTSSAYNLVRECLRNFAGRMAFADARKIASARVVAAVERMARTDPRIATEAAMWDADPWLLNTPGGVVDLRSGELRAARPGDHMTKITAVAPGVADCPLWLTFLNRSLGGDADLISFLQRALGYGLTGITREHALFFLHGGGGNGKGVLLNTVAAIVADYSTTAPVETFLASSFERHPTDLAGLAGKRLVVANEVPQGRYWDEPKIKTLTGGDRIAARFMRQDFFEFTPQFKLLVVGNHKPRLRSVDEAIRRRMNLIPFTVQIPKHERDETLSERLRAEWPGILAWLIAGCLAWQKIGLQPPASVQAATETYLAEQDALSSWIDECCDSVPVAWTARDALFAAWASWTARTGEKIGSRNDFFDTLRSRNYEEGKRNGIRGFRGLHLRAAAPPPLPMSALPRVGGAA